MSFGFRSVAFEARVVVLIDELDAVNLLSRELGRDRIRRSCNERPGGGNAPKDSSSTTNSKHYGNGSNGLWQEKGKGFVRFDC
jgi:hypothetical protein